VETAKQPKETRWDTGTRLSMIICSDAAFVIWIESEVRLDGCYPEVDEFYPWSMW